VNSLIYRTYHNVELTDIFEKRGDYNLIYSICRGRAALSMFKIGRDQRTRSEAPLDCQIRDEGHFGQAGDGVAKTENRFRIAPSQ